MSYGNVAAGNGFIVNYNSGNGVISVGDGSSSLAQVTVTQPYNLDDGQWHLFDVVYTGSTAIVYVDGVAVASGPLAGLTTDTSVGLTAASPTIDEVAVYPAALSAARIAAHWTASGHA